MNRYSIKTLENLSGIKAHTIRIWEQRYQILDPKRTDTNIRYYNNEDLKKLLNIVTLLNNGFRISKVSILSNEELIEEVALIVDKMTPEEGVLIGIVNRLISAGLTFDTKGFEIIFAKVQKNFSLEETYTQVLQPLMVKIGLMWTKNKMSPAQEHFISHLVRQKLMVAIDQLPLPENKEEKWLLFLPPEEYHDIGLLYAYFLLRKQNKSVIYLGSSVPVKDIEAVAENHQLTHSLFFIIKRMTPRAAQKYLKAIQTALPKSKILLSGNKPYLDQLTIEKPFIRISDPSTFKDSLS